MAEWKLMGDLPGNKGMLCNVLLSVIALVTHE